MQESVPNTVKKRDGRIVPFDLRKIADALGKAFTVTGEADPKLGEELAQVVAMALGRREWVSRGKRRRVPPPSIEEIQDLVERVLMETGYTRTAKAYILYRDKRAQLRELVSVRENETDSSSLPQVQGAQGLRQAWSKARIAAALIQEAQIPRETAELVASRVERKVFESGIHRLSTTLIRELVDNELFEMGFEGKRRRQALIGIPKFDFGELLRSGFSQKNGIPQGMVGDPLQNLSRQLVERYALEEILPEESANSHVHGNLHFAQLGEIQREYSLLLDLKSQLPSVDIKQKNIDWFLIQKLSPLLRNVSSRILLENWESCFETESLALETEKRFQEILSSLHAENAELLFVRSPLRSEQGWKYGHGLNRGLEDRSPLLICASLVAVNLPRLAYQAGRWNDSVFLQSVWDGLKSAVTGLAAVSKFQTQCRLSRVALKQSTNPSYALTLEGSIEAIRYLREGGYDEELDRTLRILAQDALAELSVEAQIPLYFENTSSREAARRFARVDFEQFPAAQEFLQEENLIYHSRIAHETETTGNLRI